MEYFFIILLIIIVCIFVCYPFFSRNETTGLYIEDSDQDNGNKDPSIKYLEYEKDHIYRAIKEIEFDYGLGKLSEDDYTNLRNQYIYQAAQIVNKIEGLYSENNVNAYKSIELEILKARSSSENIYDDIEEEIKQVRGKK